MSAERKPKPTGWDDTNSRKFHFYGSSGRSLCGKFANLTWNILSQDVHPDNQCAACRRKFDTAVRTQWTA